MMMTMMTVVMVMMTMTTVVMVIMMRSTTSLKTTAMIMERIMLTKLVAKDIMNR